MALRAEQLEAQLKSGRPLAPVYLLAGTEHLLRIEALEALRSEARRQGFAEREVFEVDGRFDWARLEGAISGMSLFASRRLVELRLPQGRPGQEGAAWIQRYCATPAPDVCLVLVAEDWSKKHAGAWSRSVEEAGVLVVFWPLRENELDDWIRRRLAARGVDADAGAVAVLRERTQGNLLAAAQEIDKLSLLAAGGRLDAEGMAAFVADSARFDVFAMTEAAMAGDAARALRSLRGLRGEGEAIVPLTTWIANQVQLLAAAMEAELDGRSAEAVLQKAGLWDARKAMFRKTLQRLGPAGCQRLLAGCAELDRAGKGRSVQDPWVLAERILVAMADRRALALLA